jgi:translation initiation factor IF-3
MNFGQFKYELKKQQQKQKVVQKKTELKGIRLSFRIGENDKMVRRKQTEKFLKAGHKVKIEMLLKGREKAHQDLARQIILDFVESIEQENKIEQDIQRQGSKLNILITPKN